MGEALSPYRSVVILGSLFAATWTAAKVAVPSIVRVIIDRGIVPGDSGALALGAAVLIGAGVAQAVSTGLRRYLAFKVSLRVEADLRARLFAHVQRLHFGFHDRTQTGELMSRANTDLQQIQFFLVFIPITLANLLTVASVAVVLLLTNVRLALLALAALPFLNLGAAWFSRQLHPVVLALQERLAGVASVVEETVAGIRVVKGFGAEGLQQRQLDAAAEAVYRESMAAARLRAAFLPFLDLLPTLGLVAIVWLGGHEVLAGRLSVGELVQFNAYVLMLIWPLRMVGMLVAQTARSAASAARVAEILETEPAVTDPSDPLALPDGGGPSGQERGMGAVRFEAVAFSYGSGGAAVLDGFDLDVAPGEAVALVGPTGCGKTTVARLLPRFYDVTGGRVLLDGVDVRRLALADLRRAVGLVFEDTFLFSDTVAANIAFAHPGAARETIQRAAELAGAAEFIEELPNGYDTQLGERGFSLSGGQRQRLAIARAILADPRVLILDDATSSVDPTKEHEIRGALAEVMAGRTTIVIAHRPATIALADHVVLLDHGRVVDVGTHAELVARSARYREVLAEAERRDEAERSLAAADEDRVGAGS
ncbi:MAG: ABC transporter ATP-binding protein [Actinobacteria bacterium]|nr:ABC transporter ATP-binding protein [Actinomycetota bacterium]